MSGNLAVDTKATSGKISVVIVKDTISYVAIGLEHYIAAQGDTPKDAMLNFGRALYGELTFCAEHNMKAFEGIEKAPQEYWDMYDAALGIKDEFIPKGEIVPQDKSLGDFSDMIDYRVAA